MKFWTYKKSEHIDSKVSKEANNKTNRHANSSKNLGQFKMTNNISYRFQKISHLDPGIFNNFFDWAQTTHGTNMTLNIEH